MAAITLSDKRRLSCSLRVYKSKSNYILPTTIAPFENDDCHAVYMQLIVVSIKLHTAYILYTIAPFENDDCHSCRLLATYCSLNQTIYCLLLLSPLKMTIIMQS